jgi:guanylate kinase
MVNKGNLIVISGPSGSGKGTVRQALASFRNNLYYSVSATTRAPRPGEVHGTDYYFVSREDFEQMIATDKLLEWASVYKYYYGTPREPVENALQDGLDVILEIDVQGGLQVKEKFPQAVLIFLLPPTPEELGTRLKSRRTDSPEEIKMRLNWAKEEVKLLNRYDYLVINDSVEEAAKKMNSIIEAESCRPFCQQLNSNWLDQY